MPTATFSQTIYASMSWDELDRYGRRLTDLARQAETRNDNLVLNLVLEQKQFLNCEKSRRKPSNPDQRYRRVYASERSEDTLW